MTRRHAYALGDRWRHDFGPVASPPAWPPRRPGSRWSAA